MWRKVTVIMKIIMLHTDMKCFKYQDLISFSFAYKVVCTDDRFSKPVIIYRGKMHPGNLLKQFLKNMIIAKM